jgi:predicted enzyme related to lactoylglutathione lyase
VVERQVGPRGVAPVEAAAVLGDQRGELAFYSGLFGWDAGPDMGPDAGGYRLFLKDGLPVAGLGPQFDASMPATWTTYIAVDDVEATVGRAEPAGGQVVMAPMDVFTAGRMAMIADAAGAVVGLWQAGDHIGAQRVNEPGTMVWNENATRDLEAAKAFYAAVVGWSYAQLDDGPFPYTLVEVSGRSVAGMLAMEGDEWGDIPSHWMAYFAVEDVDATANRARELGGGVAVEPFDLVIGRNAVLHDPGGAHFSVIALHEIDDPNAGWTA